MNSGTLMGLVNNAALLLALAVLYDAFTPLKKAHNLAHDIFAGILLGFIGMAIMLTPWRFSAGVIFDTRSILLSIAGLFFGIIPTVITVLSTIALRLYQSGAGAVMGVSVILTSAGLGLLGRYFLKIKNKIPRWYELYGFGIAVHLAMLSETFLLPREITFTVLKNIALPVMLIYPFGTVLLGLLLIRQSQRNEWEQVLRQERDLLARISETSPVGIVTTDRSGQIIYANARAEEILGLSRDKITQLTYNAPEWKITSLDGGPFPEEQLPFRQIKDTKKTVLNILHAIEWPDGRRLSLSINATPLLDPAGQVNGMVAAIQDITEYMQVENNLREREEKYRLLFDQMLNGFALHEIICNADGKPVDYRFIEINNSFGIMTGLNPQDLIGKTCLEVLPDTELFWIEKYGEVALTGKPIRFEQFSGSINKYFEVMAFSPQPGRFATIFNDITERKQIELSLRESEERYRAMIENSTDLVQSVGLDGRFLLVNPQWRRTLGYTTDEVIGLTLFDVIHPDFHQHCRNIFEKIIGGIAVPHFEVTFVTKDGKPIFLQGSATPRIFNDKVLATQSFFHDITERKQAEEKIKQITVNWNKTFDAIQDGIALISVDQHIIQSNLAFQNFVNKTPEDLKNRHCFHYVHRTDCPVKDCPFIRMQKSKKREITEMEIGDVICQILVDPIFDENNDIAGAVHIITDITEYKQAENALRASEKKYRELIDGMYETVWIIDFEGNLIEVNRTAVETLGYTKEELLSIGLYGIDSSLKKENIKALAKAMPSDKVQIFETSHKTKDGKSFPVEICSSLVTYQGKNAILSIARDTTERKQTEKALRESELRYQTLAEASPIGIFRTDPKGLTIYVNKRWCDISGLSAAEALGVGWLKAVHPDDREELSSNWQEAVQIQSESARDYRFLKPDGSITWVIGQAVPEKDENGQVISYVGTITDITDRKLAEDALRESEEKFHGIFDNVQDVYYESKIDGEIIIVSPSIAIVSKGQYCPDDLIGKPMSDFYAKSEDRQKLLSILQKQGSITDYEVTVKNKDGSLIPCTISAKIQFDSQGQPIKIIGSMHDISERKRTEETLRANEERIRQMQKLDALGQLASGIAHDFNNILGIIMGHASLLQMNQPEPVKFKHSLETIENAARRGANLVKQMLSFARKDESFLTPVNVNEIITEVVKLLNETFPKTIIIQTDQDASLAFVLADGTQIHQVILNLNLNARDAMPDGGKLLITTGMTAGSIIRQKYPEANASEYVTITVQDTGTGIDSQNIDRIFEPFFTTKSIGKGTGLGLAQVHGIVSTHNGFIDVTSALGAGTTFRIYLPVPTTKSETSQSLSVQKSEIVGGTETILVIEDEEMIRDFLNVVLSRKGYRLIFAEDGEAGIKLFRQHQAEIALVITDIGLPLISGTEVFKRIREINPQANLILASGFIDPEVKSEMFKAGLKNFIQKPYSPDEVLQKIRHVIDTNG